MFNSLKPQNCVAKTCLPIFELGLLLRMNYPEIPSCTCPGDLTNKSIRVIFQYPPRPCKWPGHSGGGFAIGRLQ